MNLSEIDLNNIDFRQAGEWPLAGRVALAVVVVAAVLGAAYYFFTDAQLQELDKVTKEEETLREDFRKKTEVTSFLPIYRAQLEQMKGDLESMLRQLPASTEMPSLLDDISNTGKSHGLEFELFKPEADRPMKDFTGKPITIKARCTYHQFGVFVSGVAALPRIVTLDNATLMTASALGKDGKLPTDMRTKAVTLKNEPLVIQATLFTYRYGTETATPPAQGQKAPANPVKK